MADAFDDVTEVTDTMAPHLAEIRKLRGCEERAARSAGATFRRRLREEELEKADG
jgi:hypothetical protein